MNTSNQNASQPTSTAVPTISSSAMLVELNISVWTGRKYDKQVSREVDVAKQTQTRAGNYNKILFADEPKFSAIGKFAGNARTFHYHATMPWSDSGLRLLTTAMYFDYAKQISAYEQEFYQLVEECINDWDAMINRARVKLGALFDPTDYPSADDVRTKFRFSVKYAPVPEVGDFRVNVGNEAQEVLRQSYANYYQQNLEQAYADVWERTYEALKNMSNKLSGEQKQIFRNTLVTNVTEMIDLLDKFNITGDTRMKQAKERIKDALFGVTPDGLREDDDLRQEVKGKVDALLKEMAW